MRAANLTPDSATGLGAWSEAEIVRAIRAGEDREGDVLPPVMPYAWLHGMSDRDAVAVARYLKSLPPVRNEVENDTNFAMPDLGLDEAEIAELGAFINADRETWAEPEGPR